MGPPLRAALAPLPHRAGKVTGTGTPSFQDHEGKQFQVALIFCELRAQRSCEVGGLQRLRRVWYLGAVRIGS